MPPHRTHVIFHAGCPDGRTAAWVLGRVLPRPIAFHAQNHGDEPPRIEGRAIWVVDIAFPLPQLRAWANDADRVIVLDHHLTAAEHLADVNEPLTETLRRAQRADWRGLSVSIVMERSGAGLASAASRALAPAQPVPDFVLDIEDRDLWRWARPGSREVCAAFDELTGPGDDIDSIDRVAALSRDELHAIGAPIVAALAATIERLCGTATMVRVAGWTVPLAEVPDKRDGSLVGARLLEIHADAPFAGYWMADADTGLVQVGLRSTDDRIDVAHVAVRFGGGGHRNASGLTCTSLADLATPPPRPDIR